MVQLGWKAPPEQYPPVEMLEYAITAEQAGFDTLEASDHFQPWSEAGQASFVWTWLGATAVKTSTIRIGTGLTCPILRSNPAIIAQAAATLACLAPKRVFLCDQKIYTPKMSAKNGSVVGKDTILQKSCFSGNAQDHIAYARQFIDLGFTHLYFHSPGPDQKAFLEGYGKDVLPALRGS